jgi:hypothetical protein
MSTQEMSDGAWGWPVQRVAVLPAPGDRIDLPGGDVATCTGSHDGDVSFCVGDWPSTAPWWEASDGGSLRLSYSCDGLYLSRGNGERDGYRCELVHDDWPGRRRWAVKRGRADDE